jgi:hypothetical protein
MIIELPLPDAVPSAAVRGPFALDDEPAYRRWREQKLACYPRRAEDLIVEVHDPCNLRASEAAELRRICRIANMAIYASPLAGVADKNFPRRLGAQLGLVRHVANPLADDDGISSLEVMPGKLTRGYIPYSSQRLLWHTDGYYNAMPDSIRAFILHCVHPAGDGGVNRLLDHEIAYILLRDAHPDYVRALAAADAMTIPANTEPGIAIRPVRTGPVFSVDAASGSLHMRYTARTRSIEWRSDDSTRAALRFLEQLMSGDSPYVFTHRLAGGEGLVCNNVLHDRTAFTPAIGDRPGRLIYRIRYLDRIAGTAAAAADSATHSLEQNCTP